MTTYFLKSKTKKLNHVDYFLKNKKGTIFQADIFLDYKDNMYAVVAKDGKQLIAYIIIKKAVRVTKKTFNDFFNQSDEFFIKHLDNFFLNDDLTDYQSMTGEKNFFTNLMKKLINEKLQIDIDKKDDSWGSTSTVSISLKYDGDDVSCDEFYIN